LSRFVWQNGTESLLRRHSLGFLFFYLYCIASPALVAVLGVQIKDYEMKKVAAVLLSLGFCAGAALALDLGESVRWNSIVGVITAPGVDNPVSGIHAGAGPWSVRSGRARVNLNTGAAFFDVDGLVLNGSNSSGTPGPVTAVVGTLVCNPGASPVILDTAQAALNVHGDAQFAGQISGIPSTCNNPLFLVRIAAPAGAAGRWIATGAERFINDEAR
jgi:hypothetical protein